MNNDKKDNKKRFVKTKEASKITGLSEQTIRLYADLNKIETYKTESGQRMYCKFSLEKYISKFAHSEKKIQEKKKIIYCRVSSRNQLDDLERQCSSLQSRFPNHELIKDCGSGLNFKRKGLKTILEQTMLGVVEEIVVAHKDRLCRFGYELIEFICSVNGTKIIILGNEECKSKEQELAEDIMSIITVFSCSS
jgi:predicted site-specific integrase-resolvase